MIYLAALLGSVLFIAIQLKIQKQKSDDEGYSIQWKNYFLKEYDDFVFSILIGQLLVFFQESIFYAYAEWAEWSDDKAIDFYVEGEIGIAGAMGLFGSLLIMLVFKFVVKKAKKLSE